MFTSLLEEEEKLPTMSDSFTVNVIVSMPSIHVSYCGMVIITAPEGWNASSEQPTPPP